MFKSDPPCVKVVVCLQSEKPHHKFMLICFTSTVKQVLFAFVNHA